MKEEKHHEQVLQDHVDVRGNSFVMFGQVAICEPAFFSNLHRATGNSSTVF